MPKLIDPKSGERKFYKGPGRSKDKNLKLYDDPRDRAIEKALWRKVDQQQRYESKLKTARKKIQAEWLDRDKLIHAKQQLAKQELDGKIRTQNEQIAQETAIVAKKELYRQLLKNPWYFELSLVFKSQNQGLALEDLLLAIAHRWPSPSDLKATKAANITKWLQKHGHKGGLSGHMIRIAKLMIVGDSNGTTTA